MIREGMLPATSQKDPDVERSVSAAGLLEGSFKSAGLEDEAGEQAVPPEDGFSWTEDELPYLFDTTDSVSQALVLRILSQYPGGVRKSALEEALRQADIEVARHTLDGIWSSITRRAQYFHMKEPL